MIFGGYEFGRAQTSAQLLPGGWEKEMLNHREELQEVSRQARDDIKGLAVRLGQLQAQTIRLNALGDRLVKNAKLDRDEFDFSRPPAQGGPASEVSVQVELEMPDVLASLGQLANELDDRELPLHLMEDFYMSQSLQDEIIPSGRPIKKGWTSSYYGMRTDPFPVLQERHKGMDFAGKAGSDVIAVASGIVIWSGDRYGYGNMVEISHGGGYISRYGHNDKNLVSTGDVVEKGQTLALMGSSGRSTGPHVHYEVLYKGRVVDPATYVLAAH